MNDFAAARSSTRWWWKREVEVIYLSSFNGGSAECSWRARPEQRSQRGSVSFYSDSAASPHRVSLNKPSVNVNNEAFKQPTTVDAIGLSEQQTLSLASGLPDHRLRTTPVVADWSDAGVRDVEFDRLISRRGSYKGGTGRGRRRRSAEEKWMFGQIELSCVEVEKAQRRLISRPHRRHRDTLEILDEWRSRTEHSSIVPFKNVKCQCFNCQQCC